MADRLVQQASSTAPKAGTSGRKLYLLPPYATGLSNERKLRLLQKALMTPLYLLISPYISLYLHIPPYILPISPYGSLLLPTFPYFSLFLPRPPDLPTSPATRAAQGARDRDPNPNAND